MTRVALDERAVVWMAGEWHVPRLHEFRHDLNPGERKQTWRIITRQCGILKGRCDKVSAMLSSSMRSCSLRAQSVQRLFFIGVAVPGAAAVWGPLAQVPPMGAPPRR